MSGSSLIKQIAMTIVADDNDAQAKIADVSAKGDELAKPKILTIGADTAEFTTAVDKAAAAEERFTARQKEMLDAAAQVAELEKSDAASADELAAAQQKLTDSSIAAADARKLLAAAEKDVAEKTKIASDEQVAAGLKSEESGAAMAGMGEKAKMAGLGAAVGIGYAVDQAMKFQEMSTTLVTGAGESEKALGMVKAGMLAISAATATSLPQVVSGMYMIESAGYHGAAGLTVLKAAAEGAKTGNADLGTVANAVTTVLTDYKLKASDAASATSGLVAIVAAGKTHMEDLAGSMSKVLPTASALHVPFAQVGGAMATMTAQGITAKNSAMELNSTMISIAAPTKAAATAMAGVGLSSQQVANTLTHQGLVAAVQEVTDAVGKKFPPGSAQYVAALNAMLGGHRGLATALALSGSHMKDFEANTESVSQSMKDGSKDVQGWDKVQEDASFKLQQTEISAKDAATAFGDALLPAVQKVLGPVSSFAEFLARSSAASTTLAVAVGGVLSLYLGSKLVSAFSDVKAAGEKVISMMGLMTGAQEAQTAATEEGAVAQEGLDVAMDANPIGLIILGITALIAVIILVVTHLKDFKQWGLDAFHFVEAAAEDAWHWLEGHWPLLLAILTGPIGLAVLWIKDHWKQITSDAETVVHDVASWFGKLPGMIIHGLDDLDQMMLKAGEHAIESLINGISSMVGSAVSTVEGFGHDIANAIGSPFGIHFSEPSEATQMIKAGQNIARGLAAGMASGQGAAIGASHQLAQAALAGYSGGSSRPAAGAAGPAGGGDTYALTVNGFVGNKTELMQEIQQGLRTLKRRNGGAPLGLD